MRQQHSDKHSTVDILEGRGRSLSRIAFAFRSFFAILFSGQLPADIASAFGFSKPQPVAPVVEREIPKITDGALQLLHILQRDSRLIDFLMEDISAYSDDQVGAAVRTLHADCKASVTRHFSLVPVLDGVEGTYQKLEGSKVINPSRIKLIGNVPASGKAPGGTLRHRGWSVSVVNMPPLGKADVTVLAPAELEVE